MNKTKSPFYVDKKELHNEIVKFYESDELSESLHIFFWNMSQNIVRCGRFNRYTDDWKEDMVMSGYVKCIDVIKQKKFDVERKQPHSYFTSVIRNCFLDYIGGERKQKSIREKIREKSGKIYEV